MSATRATPYILTAVYDSVNIFFKFLMNICVEICILEQIVAIVLCICISSINNGSTNRGWSACADVKLTLNIVFHSSIHNFFLMYLPILNTYLLTYIPTYYILIYLSILTHLRLLGGSGGVGGSGQSRVSSCKELFNKGLWVQHK